MILKTGFTNPRSRLSIMRCFAIAFTTMLGFPSLSFADEKSPFAPDAAGYMKIVAPFFQTYCNSCHTGSKPKGEFAVDAKSLTNDFLNPAVRGKWKEVVNVLNSHEMPPKTAKHQPGAKDVALVVDWVTEQAVRAERTNRETAVVLRRLNRDEYRNTIRDLIGIDFDVSGFPQDPPAGGFDNNGGALTLSPLHLETYLNAARQILDRALVDGERPKGIKWRFEPKVGPADRTRLKLDAKNNPIVNGGNNKTDGEWVVIHHDSWDKHVGSSRFAGKDDKGAFHFPGFHPEATAMLLEQRSIAGIAVDTLSLDHGPSKDFKTHTTWLPTGRWGLENVAGLGNVPPRGATLVVGAPKVKGASGGPARVIALV